MYVCVYIYIYICIMYVCTVMHIYTIRDKLIHARRRPHDALGTGEAPLAPLRHRGAPVGGGTRKHMYPLQSGLFGLRASGIWCLSGLRTKQQMAKDPRHHGGVAPDVVRTNALLATCFDLGWVGPRLPSPLNKRPPPYNWYSQGGLVLGGGLTQRNVL